MSKRAHRTDEDADPIAPVASGRARAIPWSHPALACLSEAARLIYACLVDGRSDTARATLRGVDVVWRNRFSERKEQLLDRAAINEICFGVQELLDGGLVLLRDEMSVHNAWIRLPWEPSLLN